MDAVSDSYLVLHHALLSLLRQGEELLERLTDAQYRDPHPEAGAAGIGGHYRHTLDHFLPILNVPEDGVLDYDARERNTAIEQDRSVALDVTRDLLKQAESLNPQELDRSVEVRCSVSTDPESPVVPSSLPRELMYAEIHAVHHYAIIKILCKFKGVPTPEQFGVAPSTINHHAASSS